MPVIAALAQTVGVLEPEVSVMVAFGFTVTVNVFPVLEQPVLLFVTTMVPVYMPVATLAAMGTVIGLVVKELLITLTSPAVWAAAFQVIE
jgi:hypothetical protein